MNNWSLTFIRIRFGRWLFVTFTLHNMQIVNFKKQTTFIYLFLISINIQISHSWSACHKDTQRVVCIQIMKCLTSFDFSQDMLCVLFYILQCDLILIMSNMKNVSGDSERANYTFVAYEDDGYIAAMFLLVSWCSSSISVWISFPPPNISSESLI